MLYGHERGVKETERRWTNAVAKAEWADRYPSGVSLGAHGLKYEQSR
jgi:hypothetical protein